MSLTLTIIFSKTTKPEMSFLFKPATTGTVTINSITYSMTLVDLRFTKQMYKPGEIYARIQMTDSTTWPTMDQLMTTFIGKSVELKEGSDTIASSYYIYELIPEYRSDSLYVDFKMYSVDKLLTKERQNRSFAAKRLGNDILLTEAEKIELPYKSAEDTPQTLKLNSYVNIHPRNKLFRAVTKHTTGTKAEYYDDYIQPYLVQYDESFYDMLIRTANRWGEFVFFEGDQLHLGYDDDNVTPIAKVSSVYSFTNSPVDMEQAKYRDTVSNDEYLEYIEEGEYLHHCCDFFCWDTPYGHKVVQSILNMKSNVFDWMVDNGVDALFTASENESFLHKKGNEYNETYFKKPSKNQTDDALALVKLHYSRQILRVDEDVKKAIEKVNAAAPAGKTYHDYIDENSVVITPDGAGKDLKSALEKLRDALKKETELIKAEKAVDKAAPSGKTFRNYIKDDGTIDMNGATGTLKTALKDLDEKYTKFKKKASHLYCQFAGMGPLDDMDQNLSALSSQVYPTVLENELKAGSQTLCIDLGENYKHVKLGSVITVGVEHYIVTRVEGTVDEIQYIEATRESTEGPITKAELKTKRQMHYRIEAVKQVNATSEDTPVFYPPMLPSGHVRSAGPQMAFVADTFDPKLNSRYRVHYPWQGEEDDNTPWLPVAHEMMSDSSGSIWQLEENSAVLLDYKDGNVERPYIVGALQTEANKAPRAAYFNNMNLSTPAGHAICLTDGYGAKGDAFAAKLVPIVRWLKNWIKIEGNLMDDSNSKYYEGGVEIKDKYGIYSITASTDERNISIKSPYGDVNLNAFTGITISAPNGDVKIQGKNVSIEAGNKLTLESGKNIHNALFGPWYQVGSIPPIAAGVGLAITQALAKKAASLVDVSLFRHIWEVFVRPVDGTLEIKSNRYLLLEAGKGEATIKRDRYATGKNTEPGAVAVTAWEYYVALAGAMDEINTHVDVVFNELRMRITALDAARDVYIAARRSVPMNLYKNPFKRDEDILAIKILKDVYDDVNHAHKDYTRDDIFISNINQVIYEAYRDRSRREIMRTNVRTNVPVVVDAARAYSLAAEKLYTYLRDYAIDHRKAQFFGQNTLADPVANNVSTKFYDKVKANAAQASQYNPGGGVSAVNIIRIEDFAPRANPYDIEKGRKKAKQSWFYAVYKAVENELPWTNHTAPFEKKTTWSQFVNHFIDKAHKGAWGKLDNMFINIPMQFTEALQDRKRWAAGKHGQIILSDQPGQSLVFVDGTPTPHRNELAKNTDAALSALKQLLHSLD